MAKKAHYLAIDKCPHGTVALSINNDIGGTRLTSGCCGSWATQREFHVDVDALIGLLLPYAKNDELTALRAQVSALQTEKEELRGQVERLAKEVADANRESDFRGKSWSACANALTTAETERDQLRAEVERLTRLEVEPCAVCPMFSTFYEKGAESMRGKVEARLNCLIKHLERHSELSQIAVEDNAFQEAMSDVESTLDTIRALPLKETP